MNTNDIIVCLIIVLLFAMFAYIYRDECESIGGNFQSRDRLHLSIKEANPLSGGKRIETMDPVSATAPTVTAPTITAPTVTAPTVTAPSTISAANYEAIMNVSSIYNDSMATFTGLNVKDNTTTKSLKVSTIDSSIAGSNVSINSPLIVTSSIKFDPTSKFCVDNVCLDPPYLKNMIQYYQQPGKSVQPIQPFMYSPIPSEYNIYDDIYSAQAQGVWTKYGNPKCYNDTSFASNPWVGYKLLGLGQSTDDNFGGIHVIVPSNMSVIWIRVCNDRWSIYKISGYLNYVCGWRNLMRLRPNGGTPTPEDNGQQHRWVPYPVPGPGKYLLTGGKYNDVECYNWISGIAFSTNPNNHTSMGPVASLWRLNGDNNVIWHHPSWPDQPPGILNTDNLAGLPGNKTITIILPVVDSKNDKMLYILTRGQADENDTITNYKLLINGNLIENFTRYPNTFSRYYNSKANLLYFGAKIPAAYINGISIIVTIVTTNSNGVYFREMGTHNF